MAWNYDPLNQVWNHRTADLSPARDIFPSLMLDSRLALAVINNEKSLGLTLIVVSELVDSEGLSKMSSVPDQLASLNPLFDSNSTSNITGSICSILGVKNQRLISGDFHTSISMFAASGSIW